jgi:hypothetical protein
MTKINSILSQPICSNIISSNLVTENALRGEIQNLKLRTLNCDKLNEENLATIKGFQRKAYDDDKTIELLTKANKDLVKASNQPKECPITNSTLGNAMEEVVILKNEIRRQKEQLDKCQGSNVVKNGMLSDQEDDIIKLNELVAEKDGVIANLTREAIAMQAEGVVQRDTIANLTREALAMRAEEVNSHDRINALEDQLQASDHLVDLANAEKEVQRETIVNIGRELANSRLLLLRALNEKRLLSQRLTREINRRLDREERQFHQEMMIRPEELPPVAERRRRRRGHPQN